LSEDYFPAVRKTPLQIPTHVFEQGGEGRFMGAYGRVLMRTHAQCRVTKGIRDCFLNGCHAGHFGEIDRKTR